MTCIHSGVVIPKIGTRTDACLSIMTEIGLLPNTFSSNVTRKSLPSIQNLFTSLWVVQSFLSTRALVVCENQLAYPSYSNVLHHTGFNHLHILQELQIWLLSLTVPCTNFASHHIKTKLMASVTGKWLDKDLGDRQRN